MTQRLDLAMVERGLAPTRSKAQALIMAGVVLVDDRPVLKAGEAIGEASAIALVEPPRFVSRGGEKLDHALTAFGTVVSDKICADIGASTGGFTDVLLQRGARTVFAIDVGYGQLALALRNDPRVLVMDRTNARYIEALPEPVDLTTVDASFISLTKLFPAITRISKPGAELLALIKPQFEAGKGEVGKHGVVRDPAIHSRILRDTIEQAVAHDLFLTGLTASPIKGPAGNIEFLGGFRFQSPLEQPLDTVAAIEAALAEAPR